MILELFILSAFLFSIGLAIVITRKNAIFVLMGIELMLNASNINLVAIGGDAGQGIFFGLFVIVIAAAEAAVGLALVLKIYHYYNSIELDKINELKD
ncbi:NADH-quinone oxidoreductase subunit NuoK [Fulvivirga lutea]|uniref:NADH-quinone oxidoreductase subunit K n=1 Tax=Fulvivirga lutea TaxID=2810512 RepID=A0A974WH08_9BACT|nr:NADH-quinone oxidoreductase subunit NuoK [Fulvivirga lutea]QSE95945.1 NADH-quinone oxidoreductase subunit NuoK [Fulvivirga lutea]